MIKIFSCAFTLIGLFSTIKAQDSQIRGFTDVQIGAIQDTTKKPAHGFGLGQFDLFFTSQVDEKTTFLGEVVFEADPTGETVIDIERIIIRRYLHDFASISLGKVHTPIGYWNNAYHHGSLIQPTINRPDAVRFEDDGGTLPIHQVGLQIDGAGISKVGLYYSIMVSNGLGKGNYNNGDYSQPPAICAQLGIEPIDNFKIFGSFFVNHLDSGNVTYQGIVLPSNSNYSLINGGVSYIKRKFEFIGEVFNISNQMGDSLGTKSAISAYAYAGYTQFKLKPYVVFNFAQYTKGEQFFVPDNLIGGLVGVRYNFSPKSVIKLELGNTITQMIPALNPKKLSNSTQFIKLQYCIGF